MYTSNPGAQAAPILFPALLALSMALPGDSIADTMIVCSEIADNDRTRAIVNLGSSVSGLEIVTPEHAWSDPDLPKGESDVSPNLIGQEDVTVTALKDAEGRLRILDFSLRDPDALEMEGLRGSLVLHEEFFDNKAFASLYYTATGNLISITPLVCEQIDGL